MYDLELLRKFCIVAKCKSFTKASKELYISQPALSKSIKVLEEQMGVLLFERDKKSVQLTKDGKVLYDVVSDKIEYVCNIDSIIESFKQGPQSTLAIGANSTITHKILIPALKQFSSNYPNINLIIKNKVTSELIRLLKEKKLDLIVVNLPIKNVEEFDVIELKSVQDVFFASDKYNYLKDRKINIKQLETLPIIINARGSVVREHFEKYCSKNNVMISPHIETVRNSLITDFSELGLGIGFATYEFIKERIEKNNLFILDIIPKVPSRSIGILTRKEPKTEVVKNLINNLYNI